MTGYVAPGSDPVAGVQCAPGPFITGGGGPHRARSIRRTGWLSSSSCVGLSVLPDRVHTTLTRTWAPDRISVHVALPADLGFIVAVNCDCYVVVITLKTGSAFKGRTSWPPYGIRSCTNLPCVYTVLRDITLRRCVCPDAGGVSLTYDDGVIAVNQIMRKKIQPNFVSCDVCVCMFSCIHTWSAGPAGDFSYETIQFQPPHVLLDKRFSIFYFFPPPSCSLTIIITFSPAFGARDRLLRLRRRRIIITLKII